MLLFIALAHAHMYLFGHSTSLRGYLLDGSPLDRIIAGIQVTLVDGRALPLFAALFGYGLVQLANRRMAAGATWPEVRRLLRRRSRWLIAFGFLHALLLFFGDILATYGLVGLIMVGLLVRRDRVVLRHAWLWVVLHAVVAALFGLMSVSASKDEAMPTGEDNPLVAALMRVSIWSGMTPTWLAFSVIAPFLFGIWAARRRMLEEPGQHRSTLRRVAVVGLGLTVIGGLPLALIDAQVWSAPADGLTVAVYAMHSVTGIAGGLGFAALLGLIAHRFAARPGPVATALIACGQRSLTCYLLQSVVFVAVFAPYAGGLGKHLGDAAASGIAVATWLGTVALAELMRRADRRGPAEVLLRRLTYRKT